MRKRLMTTPTVLTLLLIVASVASWQFCSPAFSVSQATVNQKIEEARTKLNKTFNATLEAESAGADITGVVDQLNYALNYTVQAETALSRGDLEQAAFLADSAVQLCDETLSQVESLRAQAETTRLIGIAMSVIAAIALVFVGVFIFFYGRRLWARRREDEFMRMRVKRRTKEAAVQPDKEVDMEKRASDERIVVVAVLAALIVVSGLLVYVSLTPPIPENFASVYILNSEGKASHFPELLVLGKNNTFSLRVGVENFMGRIEYGVVYVKVANGTVLGETLIEETVMSFERILGSQETWEFPITMSLNQKGVYRVSFELWLYDEVKSAFADSHIMSGFWLEVVAET